MILKTQSEGANIWVMVSFLVTSLLIALLSSIYLHRRRKRHSYIYPQLMKNFREALKKENINSIIEVSDQVIWNEHFSPQDRKYVYHQLNLLVQEYPELKKSWEHAYFKRFGTYPE